MPESPAPSLEVASVALAPDTEGVSAAADTASATPTPVSHETTEEKLTRKEICFFSIAGLGEGLAYQSVNGMAMPILNMTLGVSPAIISMILSFKGIWDGLADPIMGHFSDNFRSRWGRRRPFILIGGILVGLLMFLAWQIPSGLSHTGIMVWYTIGLLLLTTSQTVFSVPYGALAIEMAPSYHERTRLVAWRSMLSMIAGVLSPWFFPFCLMGVFSSALQGVQWLSAILGVVCIITCTLTFFNTKERLLSRTQEQEKERLIPAIRSIASNVYFWRLITVYLIMIVMIALSNGFNLFVNIYYVFQGDKLAGARMGGIYGTMGTVIATLGIPLTAWISRKYQKHNALRFAIGMMMLGQILTWFVMVPEYPYAQLILPFCFSFGIASVFTVLSSMLFDLVDVDELLSGKRREGIFGAVCGWIMKSAGALASALVGILIVAVGFDVKLEAHQTPQTFFLMRCMISFVPALMAASSLVLLIRYPLTEQRMNEIKVELDARRSRRSAA